MRRVGFVFSRQQGGWRDDHPLRDLLHAIVTLPDRKIEPVLLVPDATPDAELTGFAPLQILRTPLADGGSWGWRLAREVPQRLLGRDLLMDRFLHEHRIDVLSHAEPSAGPATLPTIGWIADFQHRRVPQFFSSAEIAALNADCETIAEQSTVVLLASRDALQDFARQCPDAVAKGRVLHHVACPAAAEPAADEEADLRRRYELQQPYFLLPNPFWVHKNHRIVLEALAILKTKGRPASVVCIGDADDQRQPGHLPGLLQFAAKLGVDDRLRMLGRVPDADLPASMRHALAVIDPSHFDGWSTSVEACKSLGLGVILSDTAVHREQAPSRGRFFDPDSAPELAAAMSSVAAGYSMADEREQQALARRRLPQRMREFGEAYQAIVLEIA